VESPPPSSSSLVEEIKPKRWPVLAAIAVVAVVGVGAVVFFAVRSAHAGREREAKAWATLARCLTGPEPLAPGEKPSVRVRRIQLTAMGVPWRAQNKEPWPGWCAPRAHAVHEALSDEGHAQAGAKDLAYWAEHVGKQLKDSGYPETDLGGSIDALWDAATKQGLPAAEPDDVTLAPTAAQPLTVDKLRSVPPVSPSSFTLEVVSDERVPTEPMRLLFGAPGAANAPLVCVVRATGATAQCSALPDAIKGFQPRLMGGAEDGAAPLAFAAPAGQDGILRTDDGKLVDQGASYGGLSRADGFTADLVWDAGKSKFRLRRSRAGEAGRDAWVDLPGVTSDAQVAMLWDAVVWAANGSVQVRHVLDGDAPLGAASTVAVVPDEGPAADGLWGCKTPQGLALFVRAYGMRTSTLDTGDRWSTPATFSFGGGRVESMTCGANVATLTAIDAVGERGWVEGRVTQARCAPGTCATRTTELSKVFPDVKETMPVRLAASDLDGKLLLVWQAGAVGGLRMRLAPQERIEEPGDAVLYDDLVQDAAVGDASTLLGWTMFSRRGYSVVVLATSAGVHLLRIDASGAATPLAVTWAPASTLASRKP
jgi:hypothetical protein